VRGRGPLRTPAVVEHATHGVGAEDQGNGEKDQ
jgi:hypothetical protein